MKNFWMMIPAVSLLAGCGKEEVVVPLPLRPVHAFEVGAPVATTDRTFSGTVRATDSSALAFQVSGRVTKVNAVAGRAQQKGDELIRIDATDYETQRLEAEARFTEAKSTLRRTQSLYETGNASKGQLDTAMAAEKTAQAALTTAEKRVKDCVLLMPYDGVVGKVSVREQESVSSGKAVLTLLADGGGFEFSVGVPGEWIGRVKPGMKGAVVVRALGEKAFEAEVSGVGAEPESNSTYPVLLQLSGDGKDLREGMDGEAILSFVSGRSGGVAIPLSCVASLPGDIAYVYLLAPNEAGTEATLSRQEVKVGAVLEAGRVEIVSGLTPGSLVVSRGVHRLQPETVVALRSDLIEK